MPVYSITHPAMGALPVLVAYTTDVTGANIPTRLPPYYALRWTAGPIIPVNLDDGAPRPELNRTVCDRDLQNPKLGYYIVTLGVKEVKDVVAKAMLLYKIHFDKRAREVGGMVSFNAQHSALWANGGFSEARYEGVCFGLAVEWLKERAANREELLANLTKLRKDSFNTHQQPNMQSFITTVTNSHQAQHQSAMQLKLARKTTVMAMALTNSLRLVNTHESTYPFTDMHKLFPTRRFFYISTGGHALAAHCNWRGQVAFYDPNVGLVTDTDRQFFGKYLEKTMYATYELTDDPKNSPIGKVVKVEVYKKP